MAAFVGRVKRLILVSCSKLGMNEMNLSLFLGRSGAMNSIIAVIPLFHCIGLEGICELT